MRSSLLLGMLLPLSGCFIEVPNSSSSSSNVSLSSSQPQSSQASSSSAAFNGCPMEIVDERDSSHYALSQVAGNCWMITDLNYGTMIPGSDLPSDDSKIEKYCAGDYSLNCFNYSASYMWHEAMGYPASCINKDCSLSAKPNDAICPKGMRLPTMDDWSKLSILLNSLANPQEDAADIGWKWSKTPVKYLTIFQYMGADYWTTEANDTGATTFELTQTLPQKVVFSTVSRDIRSAFVRCVKK